MPIATLFSALLLISINFSLQAQSLTTDDADVNLKPKLLLTCDSSDLDKQAAMIIHRVDEVIKLEDDGTLSPIAIEAGIQIQWVSEGRIKTLYFSIQDIDQYRRFRDGKPYDEMQVDLEYESGYEAFHNRPFELKPLDLGDRSVTLQIDYRNIAKFNEAVYIPYRVALTGQKLDCRAGVILPQSILNLR